MNIFDNVQVNTSEQRKMGKLECHISIHFLAKEEKHNLQDNIIAVE